MPPRVRRRATMGDVLAAIERYEKAIYAPRPRCPEGAKRHQDRIDAAKAKLIEAVADYGTVSSE
jgi:hypothetical protein